MCIRSVYHLLKNGSGGKGRKYASCLSDTNTDNNVIFDTWSDFFFVRKDVKSKTCAASLAEAAIIRSQVLPCPYRCRAEPWLSPFHQAALWRSPACPPDRSWKSNAFLSTGETECPSYCATSSWTCRNPEVPAGYLKYIHGKMCLRRRI